MINLHTCIKTDCAIQSVYVNVSRTSSNYGIRMVHREGDPPAFVSVNVTVSAPIFCVLVSSWIHNCKCR